MEANGAGFTSWKYETTLINDFPSSTLRNSGLSTLLHNIDAIYLTKTAKQYKLCLSLCTNGRMYRKESVFIDLYHACM